MTKKVLVHITLIVNMLIILVYTFLSYASYIELRIIDGKKALTIQMSEQMTNDEYVDLLMQVSASLDSDIMYFRVNQDFNYQYYKTNISKDFIEIQSSQSSTIIPEGKYISTQDGGYGKIYGFTFSGIDYEIRNISELKKMDVDLSTGIYFVDKEKLETWISELSRMDMTCSEQNGVLIGEVDSSLLFVMVLFVFLLFVSVVFYAFSKARDFTIKKSIGYSNIDICLGELKSNAILSLLEFVSLIATAYLTFSIIYDYVSSYLFLCKMFPMIFFLYLFLQLVIFAAVFLVSVRCRVQNIKGQNLDKALFRVTTFFKVIVFVILITYISTIMVNFQTAYRQYDIAMKIVDKVDGYSVTTLNDSIENPENDPDKYVDKLLHFYQDLHDQNDAIVADMQQASFLYSYEDRGGNLPQVDVNDNYLDFNNQIFDVNGDRITAGNLLPGKFNVLVPAGYDTKIILQQRIVTNSFGEDSMNFIEYREDSKFFTFSKDVFTDTPGYCKNVVAWVYNPDLEVEYMSSLYVVVGLEAYISRCLYFTYDSETNLTAYEQIAPLIAKNEMSNLVISTPSVKDSFMNELSMSRNQLIMFSILLVLLAFTFVFLLIYASELYFLNHAKDISVKLMNGHSLFDICTNRLLLKAVMLPMVAILALYIDISMPIAVIGVLTELAIFYLVLKKQCQKNVPTAIKGRV
jgi:hypothetical protein